MGKIETIKENGITPILKGIKNKVIPNKEVEDLAKKRAEVCVQCPEMVKEPISYLRIKDKDKRISKRMCNDCYCAIPLKIRQSETICKYWNE